MNCFQCHYHERTAPKIGILASIRGSTQKRLVGEIVDLVLPDCPLPKVGHAELPVEDDGFDEL